MDDAFSSPAAPRLRPSRLRLTFAWFGLVDDPREDRDARDNVQRARDLIAPRRPEWSRLLFALAIPLWAWDQMTGWWYAVFVVLGALAGVVELVRWLTKTYPRGRFDVALTLLQIWPIFGLVMYVFFGDDISGGTALAYAAGFLVAIFGAIGLAIAWLGRGAGS